MVFFMFDKNYGAKMSEFYRQLSAKQELVKRTFGRMDRIDVWAAILDLDPPIFRTLDLQVKLKEETGIPETCTAHEIKFLKETGMIISLPRNPSDSRSVTYQRTDSPLWDMAEAAVNSFNVMFPESEE